MRLESSALQKALQHSAETFQHEVEEDRIQSLKDLADYVRCNSSAFWHAIEANERLILLHIVDEDAPSIKYSFTIKQDLSIVKWRQISLWIYSVRMTHLISMYVMLDTRRRLSLSTICGAVRTFC